MKYDFLLKIIFNYQMLPIFNFNKSFIATCFANSQDCPCKNIKAFSKQRNARKTARVICYVFSLKLFREKFS